MLNNHLKTARIFARLMDNQVSLFGVSFGLDTVLGLIPGLGDIAGMLLSLYLVWIGFKMKLPGEKIGKMILNILVDVLIGSVPLVGDISDIFFKANIKNLQILETHSHYQNGSEVIEGEVIN